ncbi:formate dehydrogenase delta subunit [Salinisphaera shabanensis T35B1]|uniref:formate dehydrogenase subunit delta n=1 Tax=Salinisphaera shabanensis TaxID=180542 RepID=UPI003341EAEF
MESDKMVRQANQIAQYFSVYPQARAEEGVHGHIRKFWEPRIRTQLIEYVAAGGNGLHELVHTAVDSLRDEPSSGGESGDPAAQQEIGRRAT